MKTVRITQGQLKRLIRHEVTDYLSNYCIVRNAHSEEDDSMIQYWEEQKGISLKDVLFKCPMCKETFGREQLDGGHVVITNLPSLQYITPMCQTCNRGRSDEPFFVKKDLLVLASHQEKDSNK